MRPNALATRAIMETVSIHASVKDATSVHAYDVPYPDVSIHASVKDATCTPYSGDLLVGFNPRICKRCDPGSVNNVFSVTVSIHASVKDATFLSL